MRASMTDLPLPVPTGANRRRTPRLQVDGILAGFLTTFKARMDIRDLSFGGFAAEAEAMLELGQTYDITFLPPIGENVILKARVAYCKRLSRAEEPVRFFGGFEFVHETPESRLFVGRLMTRVAAVLGFEPRIASDITKKS